MSKEDMMKGRGLVKGIAEGEALVSSESLVWSHGVDPETVKSMTSGSASAANA